MKLLIVCLFVAIIAFFSNFAEAAPKPVDVEEKQDSLTEADGALRKRQAGWGHGGWGHHGWGPWGAVWGPAVVPYAYPAPYPYYGWGHGWGW